MREEKGFMDKSLILAETIAAAASDKKAYDIVLLNMEELTIATDYFVICSANSATQVRAIADNIEEKLLEKDIAFLHKEGYRDGNWILLDYGDCVAHIFLQEQREYYALEQLWKDAKLTVYED